MVVAACYGVDRRLCDEIARPAVERGWRLAITLTPTAERWLTASGEFERLTQLTDLPVRSRSRLPGEPRPHPDPRTFLFAPASAGSTAKLALGIADNQALTVLCEALGDPSVHVSVCPQLSDAQAGHPAWPGHLATLRSAGALVTPVSPDRAWTHVLDALPVAGTDRP
ncbi:flavoprotein [Kibdelosporangium persicum]|uniref:Phosphopantothenoylcysteine decarboxylase n=1 Tax=Kibdelosporangium persicum TaxID=2698649 RepID=A0ABX2F049_9PSEU|nr:Phosphopantothenoylcysteine decarboxylase [Kibdelosporangium persicum]